MKGGFGKVYKGFIDDGGTKTTVAIKRLDCLSRQGASEFWTEVKMLSRVRHGGDLAKRLHKVDGKSIRTPLSWVERLKICIGAARALDYLHTWDSVKTEFIHRDVKSSNILLDENMAAKVSDLGLSKIGPVDQSCTHVSTNVKGTFGYLDPNYFMTGRLTRKSDVYSFGVVLLEVLCGRPAVDPSLDERGLVGWAQRNIKEGTLNDIIDLNMTGLTPCSRKKIKIIKAFVKIAVKCLQTRPKDRPTMSEVVVDLEAALALQERGEYLVRSRYNNGEQISSSSYSKTGKIMMLSRMLQKILPAKTPVRPDVKDGSSHGKKKNNKDGCLKKFYRTKVERVSKKLKIVRGAGIKHKDKLSVIRHEHDHSGLGDHQHSYVGKVLNKACLGRGGRGSRVSHSDSEPDVISGAGIDEDSSSLRVVDRGFTNDLILERVVTPPKRAVTNELGWWPYGVVLDPKWGVQLTNYSRDQQRVGSSKGKKSDDIQSYNDSDDADNQDSRLNITNIANEDSNNEGGVANEERSSEESENLLHYKQTTGMSIMKKEDICFRPRLFFLECHNRVLEHLRHAKTLELNASLCNFAGTSVVVPNVGISRGSEGNPTSVNITPTLNVETIGRRLKAVKNLLINNCLICNDYINEKACCNRDASTPPPPPRSQQDLSVDELKQLLLTKLLSQSEDESADADLIMILRKQSEVSQNSATKEDAMNPTRSVNATLEKLSARVAALEQSFKFKALV
ncbi:putative serine/threonine/dual specificity protein kinase, catalytic domain-containing protein [Tanacetum coccineum]